MIVIYQTTLHFFEALHDRAVIAGSNKSNIIDNRRWHYYDAIIWTLVHAGIAYLTGNWAYLVTGLVVRLFMMQVLLNKLRGLPYTYLGKGKIDSFCNLYIGKKTTLIIKVVAFLSCFVYEIIK